MNQDLLPCKILPQVCGVRGEVRNAINECTPYAYWPPNQVVYQRVCLWVAVGPPQVHFVLAQVCETHLWDAIVTLSRTGGYPWTGRLTDLAIEDMSELDLTLPGLPACNPYWVPGYNGVVRVQAILS